MESVSIKAAGGVKRRFLGGHQRGNVTFLRYKRPHVASARLKSSHDFHPFCPRSLLERQKNKNKPPQQRQVSRFSSAVLISLRYISGITRCSRFMAPSTCGDQSDSADNCWVWVVIKWTTEVPWFITRRLRLTSSGELSGKEEEEKQGKLCRNVEVTAGRGGASTRSCCKAINYMETCQTASGKTTWKVTVTAL